MILVTTDTIPGKQIEALGLVSGSMVKSKNMFKDIGAGLKNVVGGELVSYTKMLAESREEATARMIKEAEALGADAIVAIRFSSSAVTQGAAEMLVTGTAVKVVG